MPDHPGPQTTTRRNRAAATRADLLQGATAVFAEKGYRRTTVQAITDRAATAHGTFYLYFRNKEDVFCQMIEEVVLGGFTEAYERPNPGYARDQLEESARSFVAAYAAQGGLWRALLEGVLQEPAVEEMWRGVRRQLVAQTAQALAAGQRAGRVRPLDSVMVAHALSAMSEWAAFVHLTMSQPEGEADPERLAATIVDLTYRAVHGRVPEDGDGPSAPGYGAVDAARGTTVASNGGDRRNGDGSPDADDTG